MRRAFITITNVINGTAQPPQEYWLSEKNPSITIGRSQDADFSISGWNSEALYKISRIHATVFLCDEGVCLRDGNGQPSKSGIWLNGCRVPENKAVTLPWDREETIIAVPPNKITIRLSARSSQSESLDETVEVPTLDIHAINEHLRELSDRVTAMERRITEIAKHTDYCQNQLRQEMNSLKVGLSSQFSGFLARLNAKEESDNTQSQQITRISKYMKVLLITFCVATGTSALAAFANDLKTDQAFRKDAFQSITHLVTVVITTAAGTSLITLKQGKE